MGMRMTSSSISVDIRVLIVEPCHAEFHSVIGNITEDKVNRMTPPCSSAITHLYHLTYDYGSVQRFMIDCSDRGQCL